MQKSIPVLYALAVASLFAAVIAKVLNLDALYFLFIVSLVSQLSFGFTAVAELQASPALTRAEKKTWTLLLLCFPLPAGIPYFTRIRMRSQITPNS